MENLRNVELLNDDQTALEAENRKLLKEILILRIFVICLILVQLYNIFHK